jgi:hypothetical protein
MMKSCLIILRRNNRSSVMPGLVPGIHVFGPQCQKTWMAGTSPAMTTAGVA